MNDTISTKYELAPEMIEKISLDPKDIFKKFMILCELKKLEITNQETINIIKNLIKDFQDESFIYIL